MEERDSAINSFSKKLTITNKFTAEKVMAMIDEEKLHTLGKEFEAYPDGLERNQFIELMKKSMTYDPAEEPDLIHGLCKLFSEIDINGDMKMQWSEFTQYVIDAVMQNPVKKNSKGELPNQKDMLEQAHSSQLRLPRFSEGYALDSCVHDGPIMRVQYYPSLDRVLVTEGKSHLLRFLSPDMKKKEMIDLYAKDNDLYNKDEIVDEPKKDTYFVLAAAYNEKDQMLACTCSNKTLQIFGMYGTSFKRVKSVQTSGLQYAIWYLEKHKAWVSASRVPEKKIASKKSIADNTLTEQKADKIQGPNFFNDWSLSVIGPTVALIRSVHAHDAQIMDCIELRQPVAIATCSLDQTIKIWDLATGEKLGSLKPKHSSGVRCLDYTPEFGGSIISTGHEVLIKVWSPEVSISQAYVGSLEGHSTSVVAAKFFKQSPYVASIDEKLSIRIWDVRTLTCLQILAQDRKKFNCNGICVIGSQLRFFVYGRRLLVFDTTHDKKSNKVVKAADDVYPYQVLFNQYYKTFYVLTKSGLWKVIKKQDGCESA
eukprot:TRINITY_DN105701_c0_g1_i1.p2 TRINITY_DN105701_c0_g1~~TRINITY_DN105701_c0_g1_i1.p2  ORF type:complete len:538 (-),score=58.24 TRINITY_DN105701_c0_g1_i1:2394-4007(-)